MPKVTSDWLRCPPTSPESKRRSSCNEIKQEMSSKFCGWNQQMIGIHDVVFFSLPHTSYEHNSGGVFGRDFWGRIERQRRTNQCQPSNTGKERKEKKTSFGPKGWEQRVRKNRNGTKEKGKTRTEEYNEMGEWIDREWSWRAGKAVQAEWPAVLTQAALMHVKIMHKYVHLCIYNTHSDFFLLLVLSGPSCAELRPERHPMAAAGGVGFVFNQQVYLKGEFSSFLMFKPPTHKS